MNNPRALRVAALLLCAILPTFSAAGHPPKDMADAAKKFLAALTPEQRGTASIEFKSDERFNWHFVPRDRKGLALKEMTRPQRDLAHALFRSGLSERGYSKTTDLLTLAEILYNLENQAAHRDPGLYYVTIFGEPGKAPWGWRLEGHHLSYNITVGDKGVLGVTPSFVGANPAEVADGPRKGFRPLAREEDLARELVQSLDAAQRNMAIIATTAPRDIITGASRKAKPLEPLGIPAAKLTGPQQQLLESLIREYVFTYRNEIAEADWKKINAAGRDRLHFAWAGGVERGQGHYYRIQGPTFLMEYDNTQNRANHIHAVWRDFENDFGEDLLRKHYEQVTHGK